MVSVTLTATSLHRQIKDGDVLSSMNILEPLTKPTTVASSFDFTKLVAPSSPKSLEQVERDTDEVSKLTDAAPTANDQLQLQLQSSHKSAMRLAIAINDEHSDGESPEVGMPKSPTTLQKQVRKQRLKSPKYKKRQQTISRNGVSDSSDSSSDDDIQEIANPEDPKSAVKSTKKLRLQPATGGLAARGGLAALLAKNALTTKRNQKKSGTTKAKSSKAGNAFTTPNGKRKLLTKQTQATKASKILQIHCARLFISVTLSLSLSLSRLLSLSLSLSLSLALSLSLPLARALSLSLPLTHSLTHSLTD